MPISLWFNLARSGGTLMARCLGCMEGVLLLSEVHPLGVRTIDPAEQAAAWHGLLSGAELPRWAGGRRRFDELIGLLAERAERRGKTLLLRDWSHLDFVGAPFVEPSLTSRTAAILAGALAPRRFATVRHPADQWASQQELDLLRGKVDLGAYARGCHAFARLAERTGFVRYEDFTRDPEAELERLCAGLGVPYDSGWRGKYRAYSHITGDPAAAARTVGEIRPARRRELAPGVRAELLRNEDYLGACGLLGYEP
ncbi:MAG TPA: hypothetical protein VFF69_08960 [Phycisphaerales bacterium]|nr:hypothetical protein [Phycisphaerales bacterium]